MPVTTTALTYNQDVAGVHNRINRFILEMIKSVSSGAADMINEFDRDRLLSYLRVLTEYLDFVVGHPQLDLPETHPLAAKLSPNPVVPEIENESICDVIRLLEIARGEILNSQSSRAPSGLISFDEKRCRAIIDKVTAFVTFLDAVTPVDLPESTPDSPMTGHGLTGA